MHSVPQPGAISTLLLDIGGVLLTNGWPLEARLAAVEKFMLNKQEIETRHALFFYNYEVGKITLDEYLDLVVFYTPRSFAKDEFITFMFSQSQLLPGAIAYFLALKNTHQLKVIAVSNEGRELNEHRIRQFQLDGLFDAYISSCYVHLHKPDEKMLRMACDVAHTHPSNALYIDDGPLLVEVGRNMGLKTLHYQELETARAFIDTCIFHKNNK